MASAERPSGNNFKLWFNPKAHPALYQHFSEAQCKQMFSDDLFAGRVVPLILSAVITGGVVLAIASVLVCW